MKSEGIRIPMPLILLLCYITMILLTIFFLNYFTLIATPIFVAIVIAFLFYPVVSFLEKKTSVPRRWIIFFIVIFLVLAFILLLMTLLPYVIDQLKNAAEKFPQFAEEFSIRIEKFGDYINKTFPHFVKKINIVAEIEEPIKQFFSNFSDLLVNVFSSFYALLIFLAYLVLIPIFIYYFLKDAPKIKETVIALLPLGHREAVLGKVRQLSSVLSSFIRGQATVVLILMVLYSLGLTLLNIPFALIVGVFSGLGDIIPYFGTIVGLVVSLLLCFVRFQSPEKLLLVLLFFSLVKGCENWFFYPKIVGRKVGLHFIWVLVALVVFSKLFGFWGLVIAIPASAGFNVLLGDLIFHYRRSNYYKRDS